MKSILIVDDQPGIRMLLDEVFKKDCYTTFLASNGIEAINLFNKEEIDCVLLDMKIPGMDGLEILQYFKQSEKNNVPVFMMTAYGEQELLDEAIKLGVQKFFVKPFNIFDVCKDVNAIFEKI